MLPVSPKSQLRAKQFLDSLSTPPNVLLLGVRALFSIDGENLKIGTKYTYPNTSEARPVRETWHNATVAVQSNDWKPMSLLLLRDRQGWWQTVCPLESPTRAALDQLSADRGPRLRR